MMKHGRFGEFWLELNRRLESRAAIRPWAADAGEGGRAFDAFTYGPFLVADTPDAKTLLELPRTEVELVWTHWHEYLKSDWIQEDGPATDYIISLIHWMES